MSVVALGVEGVQGDNVADTKMVAVECVQGKCGGARGAQSDQPPVGHNDDLCGAN